MAPNRKAQAKLAADAPDEPAKVMIRRSFAAFRARQAGKAEWIESRIDAALERRTEIAPDSEQTWLERVASSAGLPFGIVESLAALIDAGELAGDTASCLKALFDWIEKNPAWLLQLLRPTDVEGLFGTSYRELDTDVEKAKHALPTIRTLLNAWIAAKPLCELERAIGTPETKLKTCETARPFAVRVASDLAFVAGLPARILAARAVATGTEPNLTTVLATMGGAVRKGCDSPETLANAVLLRAMSRPAARAIFEDIKAHIQPGDPNENFDDSLARVRQGHDISKFDTL